MAFILYSKGTAPTGKALAEALGIEGGSTPPKDRIDLLVRWGSTERIPFVPRLVLNRANAISLAADKLHSWEILKAQGISVPEIITNDVAQGADGLIKVPTLGRKRHHTQGQDIVLCMQSRDVRRCIRRGESDYFVTYIPTDREYRIHVFKNKIIRVSQKLLKDGEPWVPFVRNFENGYVFGQPKKTLTPDQEQLCIKAVKILGLDFGAVDLIYGDDKKSYVLEVNTGPALIENGLDAYSTAIKEVLRGVDGLPVI